MQNQFDVLARYSRICVLVSCAGLLLVFTLSTLVWPSCNRNPNTVMWGIHLLPVLLFVPGIIKKNVRSHVWLTFILLGYFMTSVNTAFACTSALTVIEVGLIVILFISAMLYIRWQSKALKQSEVESVSQLENQ